MRAALLFLSLLFQPPGPEFDVLITGGRIVDGAGSPWFLGDVAISGDRIAAVGYLPGARAKTRIDARGLVVAPGFIDIHNHGRRGIFDVPTAENWLRQGVATIIEGPDGSSPLPAKPYLDRLSKTPISVNFGMFAGQGSIREAVLKLENRRATPEEIGQMKEIARQAMRDGAFGLSTGLFYVPGNFTPTEEVIEIATVVGEMGGMHISHMRDEAAGILDSVRETIRIGEEGHLPTQLTHHKIIGKDNWGKSVETLRLVEQARARGVDVTIDQYPYTASSTGTGALFPQWSLAGGRKAFLERLDAPDTRAKMKAVIMEKLKIDRGAGDPANVVMAACTFDPSLAGKNLAQITAARGLPVTFENAAETAIDIQRKGGCSAVFHAINEQDVERILRYPFTMIASDGSIPIFGEAAPHPRSYGTFARVLGRYVRERGVITLEDAVRKMTSLPAGRLKLFDRGLLRPGMMADVVVFDAGAIIDKAEYDKPHQYAAGVVHLFVNGKPALFVGKVTDQRPGRVLHGPAWRR